MSQIKHGRRVQKAGRRRRRTDRYKPRPPGRPSVYKEEYCNIVKALLSLGHTVEYVCESLDISISLFYQWKEKYPRFLEAIISAKNDLDLCFHKSLIAKAQGYYKEDEKLIEEPDGRTRRVRYKRYYEPDTQVILNHVNKRAPIYKEVEQSQAKGLFVAEFSKLRSLFEPQSPILAQDVQTHAERMSLDSSEDEAQAGASL